MTIITLPDLKPLFFTSLQNHRSINDILPLDLKNQWWMIFLGKSLAYKNANDKGEKSSKVMVNQLKIKLCLKKCNENWVKNSDSQRPPMSKNRLIIREEIFFRGDWLFISSFIEKKHNEKGGGSVAHRGGNNLFSRSRNTFLGENFTVTLLDFSPLSLAFL